jgi:hypothetical protein
VTDSSATPVIPLEAKTRHLTILAADLTGPDAKFVETFDQWAAEDLMDAVALIDLADTESDL